MDDTIRKLDQAYDIHQDEKSLDDVINYLLRIQSYDAWQKDAVEDANNYLAQKYFSLMQRRLDQSVNKWVNVYEDFTARSTIYCNTRKDLRSVQAWCHHYYTVNKLFYQGREVHLIDEDPFFDPPAKIKIAVSDEPCFLFDPVLEPGQRREINLWGQREGFISFALVEEIEAEPTNDSAASGDGEEIPKTVNLSDTETVTEILGMWPYRLLYQASGREPEEIEPRDPRYPEYMIALGYVRPHWINVYSVTRQVYGGPEEGGWYYDDEQPIACVYIGILPTDRTGFQVYTHDRYDIWPEEAKAAFAFLGTLFDSENDDSIMISMSTEIAHGTARPRYE